MAEVPKAADAAATAPPAPKAGVTNTSGAGTAEATLLMIGALRDAAHVVATRTAAVLPAACGAIVVIAGEAMPDFALLDQFDLACAQLSGQLDAALADPAPAVVERDMITAVAGEVTGVNSVTALIKAVAAAAQFFAVQTTYTGVTLEPNDAALLREVTAALLAKSPQRQVLTGPIRNAASRTELFQTIQDLSDRAAQATASADALGDQPASASRVTALRSAATAVSDFCARLVKVDGTPPLAAIIGLHALRSHLADGGAVLATHVAAAGGGLLTRTGSFLGIFLDPPNRVFGMAVAAFTLAAGPALETLAAGNVRAASPYVPMRDIDSWGRDAAPVKRRD